MRDGPYHVQLSHRKRLWVWDVAVHNRLRFVCLPCPVLLQLEDRPAFVSATTQLVPQVRVCVFVSLALA